MNFRIVYLQDHKEYQVQLSVPDTIGLEEWVWKDLDEFETLDQGKKFIELLTGKKIENHYKKEIIYEFKLMI